MTTRNTVGSAGGISGIRGGRDFAGSSMGISVDNEDDTVFSSGAPWRSLGEIFLFHQENSVRSPRRNVVGSTGGIRGINRGIL
jgi:hypothetical protein